jgi:hypothetical protein
LNEHDAVALCSVAVHRTEVVPTGNRDADAGVHAIEVKGAPLGDTVPPVIVGAG